jgi:dTDP-4-amino-4,6-dideoxygalactose transaminase
MTVSGKPLAILGGTPAFAQPLHVGRPNIGAEMRFRQRMDGILTRRWLTNDGPLVQEFEHRVAERIGVRHCVATCNGTLGLQLLARALGLRGEVIVPAFTFIATASALSWEGLRPVFCDIDADTHCIDPQAAGALLSPDTAAIIGVHLWGRICDTTALEAIARQRGIPLLIDAAHAFGSSAGGRMAGSFGNAEILSFHGTKIINAFEGGAVVTNDDGLASEIRALRNFGFIRSDITSGFGINAKMSEASAAMGLTSLESLDDFIAWNRVNFEAYRQGLADLPGVRFMSHNEADRTWNHHYVVAEIDASEAGLSRDMLLCALHAEGVLARRYFYPGCHRAPALPTASSPLVDLSVTDRVAREVLQFPTGTAVGEAEIARIAEIVRTALSMAPRIAEAVATNRYTPYDPRWMASHPAGGHQR